MSKYRIIRNIFALFLLMILSFVFVTKTTYSYFDSLVGRDTYTIGIGNWIEEKDIIKYINYNYNDLSNYILNEIGSFKGDKHKLDPLFEKYTYQELKDTVNLIYEFSQKFLTKDQIGNYVFPSSDTILPLKVNYNKSLLPGESIQINKIVQTANLSSDKWYSPITISITMEAPNGEDISDYALELLLDGIPFKTNQPFAYDYVLVDKTSYNDYRIQDSFNNEKDNILIPVNNEITFDTQVYRFNNNVFNLTTYRHKLLKPTFTGNWSRIPYGPNAILGMPSNSDIGYQQQLESSKPNRREGMILMGKANGTKTELRINIYKRIPNIGSEIPMFPFILNLSRGLRIDNDGKTSSEQSSNLVDPIINIKIVNADIWQ